MDKQELQMFIGTDKMSVSETMQKIDKNASGILFLVDDQDVLKACITDGDIRRFLLAGGKMTGAAMDASNKNPKCAKSVDEAKKIYHKRYCVAIPIIDNRGKLLDVYNGDILQSKTQRMPLNIPVVINAGGKGTRLDPFTRVLPKPLIPVGELPIIELIMKEYQSYSCNDFHIIVNYKRDLMKAYFTDNERRYNISWYDEEKPLISFLVNTGIYIVEPQVIDDIEDDVAIGFPDIVELERVKGRRVAVFPVSENDWMDMGQLPELEKMRVKLYGE